MRKSQLITQGYVELVKHKMFIHDPNQKTILRDVELACAKFLAVYEEELNAQSSAACGLDALHVFAIGIIFSRLTTADETSDLQSADLHRNRRQRAYQCVNILTLLSMRYSAVRSLRDILTEQLMSLTSSGRVAPPQNLRELVRGSDVSISSQLHSLIFSEVGLIG